MNTALKLNKKQLFELYAKSSALVKKNLRTEFGEMFFVPGEVKPEVVRNTKPSKKRVWRINWETIFDFTSILRLAIYAGLLLIIF